MDLTENDRAAGCRPTTSESAFPYKSLGFVFMVMRVAVISPVKEVTTLFVSGAASVNLPEK
jgi:hypothetical protein